MNFYSTPKSSTAVVAYSYSCDAVFPNTKYRYFKKNDWQTECRLLTSNSADTEVVGTVVESLNCCSAVECDVESETVEATPGMAAEAAGIASIGDWATIGAILGNMASIPDWDKPGYPPATF